MRPGAAAQVAGGDLKRSDTSRISAEEALTQYGALCYRAGEAGGVEILLITSRDTGRWVLPKGWPMRGRTGPECALREAFEEAGVVGDVGAAPVGIYSYNKVIEPHVGRTCAVTVFPVAVRKLRDSFPERGQRRRQWFAQQEAASLVAEPELRAILNGFVPPATFRAAG